MKTFVRFFNSLANYNRVIPRIKSHSIFVLNLRCISNNTLLGQQNWGSKKSHRNVKLVNLKGMADPKIEEQLAPLRQNVKEQVRDIASRKKKR